MSKMKLAMKILYITASISFGSLFVLLGLESNEIISLETMGNVVGYLSIFFGIMSGIWFILMTLGTLNDEE